jgi:acyl-CoA synthetase (AMP-forming)/AMP-acid ligase II
MESPFQSLLDILGYWVKTAPQKRAYVFLSEKGGEEASLTFAELDSRAREVAAYLSSHSARGQRALLIFPPGLDMIVGFFACLYAGIIAVPMMPPRRHRLRESSFSIIEDCAPSFCLTVASFADHLQTELAELQCVPDMKWVAVDKIAGIGGVRRGFAADRRTLAFLQYTSGSTSAPKGVMVSHGNLLDNLEMIRVAYSNGPQSTYVSWVPLYHDMGLILNVLQTFYVGALCVLLAPVSFMQRPLSWLKAIHRYRAQVAGAPNFAFDLCVDRFRAEQLEGVDLSRWKLAFNGAEPVRAETLERFSARFAAYGFDARAFYPCYGMAEATLLISGGKRAAGPMLWTVDRQSLLHNQVRPPSAGNSVQRLVGCGTSLAGEDIAIVDGARHMRLGAVRIGEIWVRGSNVAQGYWNRTAATEETFHACLAGEDGRPWLRTGDLGCLDEQGELYVTGRIKDVIIIRGINHYPQDIEHTVESCHPALRRHCGAAFSILRNGQEQLVVVQEVDRVFRGSLDTAAVVSKIRETVVAEHELTIHAIALIRTGTIPKTSSGKIRRSLTRQLWLDGRLEIWGDFSDAVESGNSSSQSSAGVLLAGEIR